MGFKPCIQACCASQILFCIYVHIKIFVHMFVCMLINCIPDKPTKHMHIPTFLRQSFLLWHRYSVKSKVIELSLTLRPHQLHRKFQCHGKKQKQKQEVHCMHLYCNYAHCGCEGNSESRNSIRSCVPHAHTHTPTDIPPSVYL